MPASLTPEEWHSFFEDGYVVLDDVANEGELHELNERLNDIMLGKVQYGDKLMMQLDPNANKVGTGASGAQDEYGAYSAAGAEVSQTVGFKGPSLAYRKIGEAQAGLECDPVFSAFMSKPLFRSICDRVYGAHAAISVYRAMVMAKPAGGDGGGTPLPWHQDGGDWWALDRDPLCFVWLALSEASKANGAVQVVKGSHKRGLLSKRGHTLSPDAIKELVDGAAEGGVVDVELRPGQAFLCHNFTVHRSGVNSTDLARRGFSVNFIDARTRVLDPKPALSGELGKPGEGFPLVMPAPF